MLRKRPTSTPRRRAFTLIELMIVIGLIALLISILVPALSHAKSLAKATAARAQMQGIARACEQYYTDFKAYPGPVDDIYMDGKTVMFTGAQNLFLGLTRRFYPGPTDPTAALAAAIPPSTATKVLGLPAAHLIWFDNDPTRQPANYAVNNPFGSLSTIIAGIPPFNTFPSYYQPKPNEISTVANNSTAAPSMDLAALPSFVDSAFGAEARPILYYRRSFKWDAENAALGLKNPAILAGTPWATTTTLDTYDPANPTTSQACFYSSTNILIDPTHIATTLTTPTLASYLSSTGDDKGKPVGEFVLVSPGLDRTYGTADDIVVVGGL